MAGTAVASILLECHISVSQEEALANLGGGWERSGLYSLDETPSQSFLASSPLRAQENSLDMHAEPPASNDGDSGSESSESVDVEGDLRFTQEPVEWVSSPSSVQQAAVEGEGNEEVAKEDSYVPAAFESDRSQSPSQNWDGQTEEPSPEVLTPDVGLGADFLTQPASVAMDSQFASSEDAEIQILRRETEVFEVEHRVLRGSSSLLPPIAENVSSVVEAAGAVTEFSLQPFTQPAAGAVMEFSLQPFTQPAAESQPFESLNKLQEYTSQTQSGGERNEIAQYSTLLAKEETGVEEPEIVQKGNSRVEGTPVLDIDNGCGGEEMPPERGDGLPSDSQQLTDDGKDLEPKEHVEHEHESHCTTEATPDVEMQRGDSEPSYEPLPATQTSEVVELGVRTTPSNADQRELMPRSDGDARSSSRASKRPNCTDELHGRQLERQGTEASPVRVRSPPEAVRSRSRSLFDFPEDDECSIQATRSRSKASKGTNRDDERHARQQNLQRTEASPVRARSPSKAVMDAVRCRSRSLSDSPADDAYGNRDTRSPSKASKVASRADELHGPRQKRQRREASPVRFRRHRKTVGNVVRSRSRSSSDSSEDDECSSILTILMRAGVSFPPFVN